MKLDIDTKTESQLLDYFDAEFLSKLKTHLQQDLFGSLRGCPKDIKYKVEKYLLVSVYVIICKNDFYIY